ncbi:MAG TPA: 50S ribosomal protein L32 [Patescibacteria group bacterium]|nr:50S ribosomal protein L32 [Patescibacteria group bacterium]
MAEPKKRMSKSRTASRRGQNIKVKLAGVSICSKCKSPKISHQVCKVCGTYNGRQMKKPGIASGKVKTKTK